MNIQGQFILTEHDKQLHFGAGMITSALGYTWSYNKHQNKKRAMIIVRESNMISYIYVT